MEATSRNKFQIFQAGDIGVSTYGAKYAVMTVPFVFPGYEVDKAYNGPIGEKLNEAIIKNGNQRIISISRRGARLLTADRPSRPRRT